MKWNGYKSNLRVGGKFQNGGNGTWREAFLAKKKAVEEKMHSFQRQNDEETRRRFTEELDFETEVVQTVALSAILLRKKRRQERSRNELRDSYWLAQGYRN